MTTFPNWYMELDMSAFAERLKLLRKSRSITQARLAKLLEIDPRAYSRWERGDNVPHVDTLVKIADILQVTLDELVGRSEPSNDLKIRNQELHKLWQQADSLPDADQQALIQVMDGLVKKAQLTKVIGESAKG